MSTALSALGALAPAEAPAPVEATRPAWNETAGTTMDKLEAEVRNLQDRWRVALSATGALAKLTKCIGDTTMGGDATRTLHGRAAALLDSMRSFPVGKVAPISSDVAGVDALCSKIAFCRCNVDRDPKIKSALFESQLRPALAALPEALRNEVFSQVYELSTDPRKGGDKWGEINATKNLDVLEAAIEMALHKLSSTL